MNKVKHLRETFTDEEFRELKEAKGDLNWHDFILTLRKVVKKSEV